MSKITLIWANMIRERLKEKAFQNTAFEENVHVKKFIEPILEYAEKEEERISKEFEEKTESKTQA